MVKVVIKDGSSIFVDLLDGVYQDSVAFSFDEVISDFLDPSNLDSLTPTALGASLIQLSDAAGRILRFEGSGFGPIVVSGDLDSVLDDFLEALQALDGSATGTLTQVVLSEGTSTLLRLTVSDTKWVVRSGTVTLTIEGDLPTSIDEVNAGLDQLIDQVSGTVDPDFDPDTSLLAEYEITKFSVSIKGNTEAVVQFDNDLITVDAGDYILTVEGDLPSNLAEAIDIVVDLWNGQLPTDYRLDSVVLKNGNTGEILMTGTGTIVLPDLGPFGSENDSLTISDLGAFEYLPATIGMGSGNDTVSMKIDIPFMSWATFDPDAFESASIATVDGGSGRDTVNYSETQFGVSITMSGSSASSSGYIHRNAPGANVDWLAFENVENVIGTAYDDKMKGNNAINALSGGNGRDSLSGAGGNDTLNGGGGDDVLDGGSGNDILSGGTGKDRLTGGSGNNKLSGGLGNDNLKGGSDVDVFVFAEAQFGKDKIVGWQDGVDKIDLQVAGMDFADFSLAQSGSNAVLTLTADPSNTITFIGRDVALIDASDFI